MVVTDASKNVEEDQAPAVGKYLLMECYIPPTSKMKQRPHEIITAVDQAKHQISWENREYPAWIMKGVRWQALSFVDGKTRYESRETMSGSMAYVVKTVMGSSLRESFDAMADGLKRAAEAKAPPPTLPASS